MTDLHSHSAFSFDGVNALSEMLESALEKGVAFYGVSEHVDFDICPEAQLVRKQEIDAEAYFHTARHLQEDYAGCMNVLVGAEFGYSDDRAIQEKYIAFYRRYQPDFVINSVHSKDGWDFSLKRAFYEDGRLRDKKEAYADYFRLVQKSLDAPYPYDIIGHFTYVVRYGPYENPSASLAEFGAEIDGVLKGIIEREKILETNTSMHGGKGLALPAREILERYFALGGRAVSFGSDAHTTARIVERRAEVVSLLKEIGFAYITVPCKGERIKVEI